jgi:hypothetical protein
MQQDPAQPSEEHSTHIRTWTTANRGPLEADKNIKSNSSSTLRMLQNVLKLLSVYCWIMHIVLLAVRKEYIRDVILPW